MVNDYLSSIPNKACSQARGKTPTHLSLGQTRACPQPSSSLSPSPTMVSYYKAAYNLYKLYQPSSTAKPASQYVFFFRPDVIHPPSSAYT
jgi:hypothetical protein